MSAWSDTLQPPAVDSAKLAEVCVAGEQLLGAGMCSAYPAGKRFAHKDRRLY